MKPIFTISAVAVFFVVAPSPCFALWGTVTVSKEEAKRMGMEFRSSAAAIPHVGAGPNHVTVELEFKSEGELKNFSSVNLLIGEGEKLSVTAPLREDRSKPGHVVVRFTADRAQLDKLKLSVIVPGALGGTILEIRVKDFVELKKDR